MNFWKFWWENIKAGFTNFTKKVGTIGLLLDISISLIIAINHGDDFLETLLILIASTLLGFIGFGLLYSLFIQPADSFRSLLVAVEQYSPHRLNISVGPSPYKGKVGDQGVFLFIISHEDKKILDFRAKKLLLCQRDTSTREDSRGNEFGSGIANFHFSWSNDYEYTELMPGAQEELEVAKILESRDMYPEFGLPHAKPPNSEKPSIYDVEIRFIGKLEGEERYSSFDYRSEILYIPNSFIPQFEFIERMRDVPENLKNKVYTLARNE